MSTKPICNGLCVICCWMGSLCSMHGNPNSKEEPNRFTWCLVGLGEVYPLDEFLSIMKKRLEMMVETDAKRE